MHPNCCYWTRYLTNSCDSRYYWQCASHCLMHAPNDDWVGSSNLTWMKQKRFVTVQQCPDFDGPVRWPMAENMFHAQHYPDRVCHDCCTSHTFLCQLQLWWTMTTMWIALRLRPNCAFHCYCAVADHPLTTSQNYRRFWKPKLTRRGEKKNAI